MSNEINQLRSEMAEVIRRQSELQNQHDTLRLRLDELALKVSQENSQLRQDTLDHSRRQDACLISIATFLAGDGDKKVLAPYINRESL